MQESSLLPCSSPPRSPRPRRRASARRCSSRPARTASAWRPTPMRRAPRPRSCPATDSGPRLFERPPGGAWSAATPLPGTPAGVAGPVVDAAGNGALGIAWRVDKPAHTTRGIAVAMRDPGGTLGRADRDRRRRRRGVRHPALAIDPPGDALLAYNSGHQPGPPQHARRDRHRPPQRGGSFSPPTIVDRDALERARRRASARDGTGVVAWTHGRRVYVVSVAPTGSIGKVKRFASPDGVGRPRRGRRRATGRPRWRGSSHRAGRTVRSPRSRYSVRALGRTAGHAFAAIRTVAATSDYVRGVADRRRRERPRDAGVEPGALRRATARWATTAITSAVLATTAQAGRPVAGAAGRGANRDAGT